MPDDVQVEEPELIGAMSADEAGEMVGCSRRAEEEVVTWQQHMNGTNMTKDSWTHHPCLHNTRPFKYPGCIICKANQEAIQKPSITFFICIIYV